MFVESLLTMASHVYFKAWVYYTVLGSTEETKMSTFKSSILYYHLIYFLLASCTCSSIYSDDNLMLLLLHSRARRIKSAKKLFKNFQLEAICREPVFLENLCEHYYVQHPFDKKEIIRVFTRIAEIAWNWFHIFS